MAGKGWNAATAGPGVEVSGDGQTITRPTTGGGGSYAGIKGNAARAKGRRYYEIEISANGCSVGAADEVADVSGTMGEGTAISFGYMASSASEGFVYYRFPGDGGVLGPVGNGGSAVYGILIDFDAKTAEIYRAGVLQYTLAMTVPNDTALYPGASIGAGNSATLQTVEPFQYPPQDTFIAWDVPDEALASEVAGVVQIDSVPVSRLVRAYSLERLTYSLEGETITESKSLGQAISDPSTGAYRIQLRGGFNREVFILAADDYGNVFAPGATVAVNDRIHPTAPNGHVYVCTGSGELPQTEPVWSTDTQTSQGIGTASFQPTLFYRPAVHGPVLPVVTNWHPMAFFQGGQDGAFWNVSILSSLFQDAAGTLPVTAPGQPVGLILDLSGNGYHLQQSDPARKPTYQTDGTYHWIKFNGLDEFLLGQAVPVLGSDFAAVMAAKADAADHVGGLFCTTEVFLGNSDRLNMYIDSRVSPTRIAAFANLSTTVLIDSPTIYGTNPVTIALQRNGGQASGWLGTTPAPGNPTSIVTNYRNVTFSLGVQGAGSLYMNGRFYGGVINGGMSDIERELAVNWLSGLNGAA